MGGEAIAPESVLGPIFYGYGRGVFRSRTIERGADERRLFRFIASGLHPKHDTTANVRKTVGAERVDWFGPVWRLAAAAGVVELGTISREGSMIDADGSQSKAVSDKRLGEQQGPVRQAVSERMTRGEPADQGEWVLPEGVVSQAEIAVRQARLENLATAKAVLEARAQERYEAEKAEDEARVRQREQKARHSKPKPTGRQPKPPQPGPPDQDPYPCTDPDSRLMKNSTAEGFDPPYTAQVATDQDRRSSVAPALSNQRHAKQAMGPTLDALSPSVGHVQAAASANGYFSEANLAAGAERGLEPSLATGREAHHQRWQPLFAQHAPPPSDDASPKVNMAAKLPTAIGRAVGRLRTCSLAPVIGIINAVPGFRQLSHAAWPSLAANGAWCV